MKRKILALMLAVLMLFTVVPAAFAEEPAEPSTEETVVAAETEQPAEEPAEEPAEQPAEEPAEEPGEEPKEDPTEQPTEEPTEEPGEEPAEQPGEEPTEEIEDERLETEEKVVFNVTNFPDAAFRAWLIANLDPKPEVDPETGDYVLTKGQATAITAIDCSSQSITDVTGVEFFPNLATLNVKDNAIETIDLTKNAKLKELDVSGNQLVALKLSGNPVLTTLYCQNNLLETLDVSQNMKLSRLICKTNHLTRLDVSASTHPDLELFDGEIGDQTSNPQAGMKNGTEFKYDMTYLVPKASMSNVKMLESTSALDKTSGIVTFTSEVSEFSYSYATGIGDSRMEVLVPMTFWVTPDGAALLINETTFPDATFRAWIIANLAVSGNASDGYYMTKAQVEAVKSIVCSGKGITNLGKISAFTNLEELDAGSNKISAVDLTKNTKLINLTLSDNLLSELNVTKNTKLKTLLVATNSLTALDLTKNTALEQLNCAENKLTSLSLTKNTKLTALLCSNNALTSLTVSKCTALSAISADNNKLPELNLKYNTKLQILSVKGNELTELNLAKNTKIEYVDCSNNKLTALTATNLEKLAGLLCSDNQLTKLDLSKNTALVALDCSNNKLDELTVAKCTALQAIHCSGNAFTTLSFPENTNLTEIVCTGSKLEKIDVSKNTKLKTLDCSENELTELELSKNTALENLNCEKNHITMLDLTHNTALTTAKCGGQTTEKLLGEVKGGIYTFHLTKVNALLIAKLTNVTLPDTSLSLDTTTGIITFPSGADEFVYEYATGSGTTKLEVTVPTLFSTLSNAIVFEDASTLRGENVQVDGKAYQVVEGIVALPDGVTPKVVTQYAFNAVSADPHTVYPTAMRVWFVQEKSGVQVAVYAPNYENILQYKGSSIRITGNKGIRMITGVPKDKRALLIGKNGLDGYKLLEYGTIAIWKTDLGTSDLTLETPNIKSNYAYSKEKKTDPIFSKANGLIQYTNVLTFTEMAKCIPDLVLRPYMKVADEDGAVLVLYGGMITRNIGYIAYQNRNAFKSTSAAYKYIWEIIHAVYGNLYDDEYKG